MKCSASQEPIHFGEPSSFEFIRIRIFDLTHGEQRANIDRMAALPARAIQLLETGFPLNGQTVSPEQLQQLLEFSGVFQGHELTRKDGRLTCGIAPLDTLLGGIARGRISEVTGPTSSGKTTVAAAFASAASRRGEVIGWIDVPGAFDPRSLEAAGADLARILWVSFEKKAPSSRSTLVYKERERRSELKAAELLLEAGGFGLVVIDFGALRFPLSQSASLRLARAAERSGAAVLALATTRICGTFAALTLSMSKLRASFTRMSPAAPALFDGIRLEAAVERNKLGVFGDRAPLFAAVDPLAVPDSLLIPLPLQNCPPTLCPSPFYGEGTASRRGEDGKGLGVRPAPTTDLTRRSSATLSLKGEGKRKEAISFEVRSLVTAR
jgi:hypothetical protein